MNYKPIKRDNNLKLMTDRASAWGDIPTILGDIIERFNIKKNKALEFGVEFGYSTSALANYFDKVVGVDTFEGDIHSGTKSCHYEMTKNDLSEWPNIDLVKSDYQTYIKENDDIYDLIHVDIIHDYKHTYECGEWSVNHSKVVIFHDTESFPEVRRACEDLCEKYNLEFYNYTGSYGLGILINKNILKRDSKKKVLVTYVYYETPESIFNFNFFIKNGVFENNEVDYNFIINSDLVTVDIPEYKNIKVIKGDNRGYDFGAYSRSINEVNINDYDYFIFLNDTVRGPFLPRYCNKDWYNKFVSLINHRVKLVGSTINKTHLVGISKHVQSMAFATDKIGIQLLIDANILNQDLNEKVYLESGKMNFILQFEVGMSGVIMNNGYQIDSFCQVENNKVNINYCDIHYDGNYFGSTINPIEVMFIKTNRIDTLDLKNYTDWNT